MDIFRDYFTREQLLASLQKVPYVPGMLGAMGLFETVRLNSTTYAVEEQPLETLTALTAVPRGTPSKIETLGKRSVKTFTTSHYRVDGAVYADEVLNVRALGVTGAAEVITDRRDRLIAKLRGDIDLTLESLRMACINSPTNALGSAPASAAVAFGASDSAIRTAVFNNILLPIESALGGLPYTGLTALCEDTFWLGLIESKTIKETYLNQVAANTLRGLPVDQMDAFGVRWIRNRSGSGVAITTGKAKVFPNGVPGLFIQAFAPADTLDSVGAGALGDVYYPMALPSPDNRMWKLEVQTNPLMLCTRPTCVLTIGLS